MINIHLFGSTTNTIRALLNNKDFKKKYKSILNYSRSKFGKEFLDLSHPESSDRNNFNSKSILVSCSPIWLFSSFLEKLFEKNKNIIKNIEGIIVCSSSSVITKRFSSNAYDKDLFEKLDQSERQIEKLCTKFKINCVIIRPSLIYGNVGKYKDNNLSKIKKMMQVFPILLLPSASGNRQPIHVSQLAALINFYINLLEDSKVNEIHKISVGGDSIISYKRMLLLLSKSLFNKNHKRKCRIIVIPENVFYFSLSILIIINPRLFASFQRIGSNLAGFLKVSEILGVKSQEFPLDDL